MEDITLLTGIALVALGLAAATYGVMVGSGGGFIVSPLLILFFRLDHDLAVGTSLIAVFLASVSGGISYFRLKRVDLRSALLFSLVAIPGALLGVLAVEVVAGSSFKIIFGVLLSLLGIFIFVRPIPSSERSAGRLLSEFRQEPVPVAAKRPPGMATRRIITTEGRVYQYTFLEPAAVAVNLVFGFLSGFFGIGGGPIRSPTLVYVFRFPVAIATATSVFYPVHLHRRWLHRSHRERQHSHPDSPAGWRWDDCRRPDCGTPISYRARGVDHAPPVAGDGNHWGPTHPGRVL